MFVEWILVLRLHYKHIYGLLSQTHENILVFASMLVQWFHQITERYVLSPVTYSLTFSLRAFFSNGQANVPVGTFCNHDTRLRSASLHGVPARGWFTVTLSSALQARAVHNSTHISYSKPTNKIQQKHIYRMVHPPDKKIICKPIVSELSIYYSRWCYSDCQSILIVFLIETVYWYTWTCSISCLLHQGVKEDYSY